MITSAYREDPLSSNQTLATIIKNKNRTSSGILSQKSGVTKATVGNTRNSNNDLRNGQQNTIEEMAKSQIFQKLAMTDKVLKKKLNKRS